MSKYASAVSPLVDDLEEFHKLRKTLQRYADALTNTPSSDISLPQRAIWEGKIIKRYNSLRKKLRELGRLEGFHANFDKMTDAERDAFIAPGTDFSSVSDWHSPWYR